MHKFMIIVWLCAMILFGVIEAATIGLVCIWFAVGALAALIAAVLGAAPVVQGVVFVAASLLTLLIIRPLAGKYINGRRIPTNADRVIGQEAVVTRTIDNLRGEGQVKVGGVLWSARSREDSPIPAGATVKVLRIEGVKVCVTPADGETE